MILIVWRECRAVFFTLEFFRCIGTKTTKIPCISRGKVGTDFPEIDYSVEEHESYQQFPGINIFSSKEFRSLVNGKIGSWGGLK